MRNTETFENPESVTLLGTKLQPNLCWDTHIEHIASKLNKNIYLLRNLSSCVSQEVLRIVYFGLIQSHLSYAIIVWGHSAAKERAFGLQRKAVRIIAKLPYRAECKDAFKTLGILTFPCLYILQCLLHAKSNLANYMKHSDLHSHDTRWKNEFRSQYLRLTKSQNGPNFWCHKFINKLPANVIDLPYLRFKAEVKQMLIEKAYFSITEFLND